MALTIGANPWKFGSLMTLLTKNFRFSSLVLVLLMVPVLLCQPALSIPSDITVKLFSAHPVPRVVAIKGPLKVLGKQERVLPEGDYQIRCAEGGLVLESAGRGSHTVQAKVSGQPLTLAGYTAPGSKDSGGKGLGIVFDGRLVRHYFGQVQFYRLRQGRRRSHSGTGAGIGMRNIVDSKDYVISVVGSESLPSFGAEALKAQAVLTLTRVARLDPHKEVSDSTEEESYFGADFERPSDKAAVESVWGQVLKYDGKIIKPFYHSTCAGRTSSGKEVFGVAAAQMKYLQCVPCHYCKPSPFWKTTVRSVPVSDFNAVFGEKLPVVQKLDCANRPQALRLFKSKRYTELSGYQFWLKLGQKFGWDKAPGTRF
ncbi:MAG TPA: SpoIID/LytB domain-containing protein [Chroococcales cyanobacterium]